MFLVTVSFEFDKALDSILLSVNYKGIFHWNILLQDIENVSISVPLLTKGVDFVAHLIIYSHDITFCIQTDRINQYV